MGVSVLSPAWSVGLRLLAAFAITAVCVAIFVRYFNATDVISSIGHVDRTYLAAGGLVVLFTAGLRSLRASLVIEGRANATVMRISLVHNALTALLPMKLGEFALPMLLVRTGRMSAVESVGALFLLRIFDLLTLSIVGSLTIAIAFWSSNKTIAYSALATFASALAATAIAMLLLPRATALLASRRSMLRPAFLVKLLHTASLLSRSLFLNIFGLSLAIWASLFVSFYLLSLAVISFAKPFEVAAAGTVASFAFAFPISAIANAGPFQAAWIWALGMLGYAEVPALAASLVVHGSVVLITGIAGLISACMLYRETRPRAA